VRFPFAVGALFFFLVFSASGSAHPSGGLSSGAFPGRNGEIVFQRELVANGPLRLYLMRPDGTHQRAMAWTQDGDRDARWSPDGRWITYISGGLGCSALAVGRAEGTHARRLTAGRWCYEGATWSPDGKRILFTRFKGLTTRSMLLWTINADGTGLHHITSGDTEFDGQPAWSPDGTSIAFTRYSQAATIWLIDADGTNVRRLTTTTPSPEEGQPQWSPDGNWIVFSRETSHMAASGPQSTWDIFVVRSDGTDLRRLTRNAGSNTGPAWSPDGKRIVFTSVREHTGRPDIFVMNADGTGQKRLTNGLRDTSPDWQPNP
jgi:Tol biopolymer transport system component